MIDSVNKTDLPLFDWRPSMGRTDSAANELARCRARIGGAILLFFDHRRAAREFEFRADELRAFVEAQCGPTAPGSCDRVMRALRQQGALAYELVSRADSHYRIIGDEWRAR